MVNFWDILGQAEDGEGWGKLVPLVVFFLIYAVSALIKGRQAKQNEGPKLPRPTVPPERAARTGPLPPYARPRGEGQGGPAGGAGPVQQMPQPRPTLGAQAPPVARPKPMPGAGPGQARPAEQRPASVQRRVPQQPATGRPAAQARPEPVRTTAAGMKEGLKITTSPAAGPALKMEIPAVAEVAEKRERGEVLEGLLGRDELARAVIYAEVLGKPVGLRDFGF